MSVEVDFFDISDTRSVLSEAEALMTKLQAAGLHRKVRRLQEHGWNLNGDFFSRVQGSPIEKLYEFRLTLDKVEFRFLFTDEDGTFVMLAVYKEKRNAVPQGMIDSAVARIAVWRQRNAN